MESIKESKMQKMGYLAKMYGKLEFARGQMKEVVKAEARGAGKYAERKQ